MRSNINDKDSDEKKTYSLLEALPHFLRDITRDSVDLAFAKDKDFRYICCSPAFVKFTGQKCEADVIGRTDYDFFDKPEADHFRNDDERLFINGEMLIDYIEPIPSDDGIQHYCSTSKYILRDGDGEIIGMYGIGRDITADRAAFGQLKLLTENIPGGLATYAVSPAGIRLLYFNDGFCKLVGYSRRDYEEVIQSTVLGSVYAEDLPGMMAQLDVLRETGAPIDYVYRIHIPGGSYKWINLRAALSERQGETLIIHAVLFDITQQKTAEESVRIHEQEMTLALSQMGRLICEYDHATHTLAMPESYAARYDQPTVIPCIPGNMLRESVFDAPSRAVYAAAYEAILRGEPTGAMELRLQWADGEWHWENTGYSTIFDSDGKPVKTIFSIEDTTQQHLQYELERSRPTLGEKNLLIHALFNLNTGETLDYAYMDGAPVPVEARTAFLYGHDNLDAIIIDDAEREEYRRLNDPARLLERYESGETEHTFDYRRRMPDGETRWVRNILHLVRRPDGSDILLFEYCYDIEEEKLQSLMYATLVRESYDYVARVDGNSGRYFIIATPETRQCFPSLSGDDIDALAHTVAAATVHPEDREMALRNTLLAGLRENLRDKDRFQFTCRVFAPDGAVRYKRLTEYYLDRKLEIIVVTREDVTQLMQAEAEKSAALADALAAANQANQAKSQFLSRMSHELRTPMNAIIGLAALSASEVGNPKAMEDAIGKIGMSARYLLSLINDILEMSRIESGRMTLTEAPFDFEQFITAVNAIIYAQASAKGVDYDAIVNTYTETDYVGDSTKLQEILVNVLGNAVKFTPSGGKVTLSIQQLRCTTDRATLRFTVSDTGIGIDDKYLPYLFDPFSQESASFVSTSTGTGLGLAITKTLVEMMSGHVSVRSIKGVGSVFTIDVQLGISAQSQQYLDILSSMNLSRLRALVVDDDVIVCRSTESILKAMGMYAEWVDSGLRAVERVKEARSEQKDFDTIFIDWKMPDMDGIETTRHIRKIVGPDVTIIIITAYDWASIEAEAREAGVDLFMEKPLFQSSIVKAFERVFLSAKGKIEIAPPVAPDFTGKNILLAEDHPLNVEVAKRLLEKVGANVTVANNGLEALETYTTSPDYFFDAILMDIRMPIMDGLTASSSIRKLKKAGSREIPIIAMTANAFDEDVDRSLSSGMDAHLTKPIDPAVMYATLTRAFRK